VQNAFWNSRNARSHHRYLGMSCMIYRMAEKPRLNVSFCLNARGKLERSFMVF
jgi:hypothetical protein